MGIGKRADAVSQISILQRAKSNKTLENDKFVSDVLISLHQTIVIMLDSHGNQIAFWGPANLDNQYGVKNLGGDLIITDVLSSEDISRWKIQIDTVFESGESIHGEFPLYLPFGEFWFDMAFSPVWGPKGEVSAVLVVLHDITLLTEKVNEVLYQYRDLQLYTSLLRHDLSNDVQVILSEAEISQIRDTSEADMMRMRDTIKASAERMARVLRAFGTGDGIQGHDIAQLLKNSVKQGKAIHHNLRTIVRVTPDARNAKVSGGRLLPMVFDNLIRNTAQHAGENPEIRIIVKLHERKAQIEFRDNGPGIPQELQNSIFHRGSGLSLCNRIIEGCGGAIYLLNEQNEGATFRVELPLIR
jgi:signal transduction histidine kinase